MATDEGDPLLRAYLGELAFLRTAGAEFARKYPKVARRLELGREGSADPEVQRLIESFAFLSARIQREIEADFPLIPASLLGMLYPHLTAPVPSLAIARLETDPDHGRAAMGFTVPADTALFATAGDGLTCRFRTCYPVTLWPIDIAAVEVLPATAFEFLDERRDVVSVLRVRLVCQGNRSFAEMAPGELRLFIDADAATAEALYEVLCRQVGEVALLPEGAARPATGRMSVRPVGFAPDEGVLPHPVNAHRAYRLVQEYFVFPEKYMFLDVVGLPALAEGKSADLLFLLTERPPAGLALDASTLRLGCTPMVNLFQRTSEPIRMDHTQVEYRLIPDSRWERVCEVHTVMSVATTASPEGGRGLIRPFFAIGHGAESRTCTWIARRAPTGRADLPGTDVFLAFKDLALDPHLPESGVVFAQLLCTSRGLAEQLPAGCPLEMEVSAPVAAIATLTRPTRQLAPPAEGEALWRLVSHLAVNHLSLTDGPEGLEALKEILRLYAGRRQGADHRVIDALASLTARRVVRRFGEEAWRGFCRGIEVTIEADPQIAGSSLYLFSAVLARFLGLYAGVNSFARLVVTRSGQTGAWVQWPPQSGEAVIL